LEIRTRLIDHLKEQGIYSVFHFVPLHKSPAGKRFGRAADDMHITIDSSDRLLRLPLWLGIEDQQDNVIQQVILGLNKG
jgi:dTDP-4-amino-4,6-dideoxygalactose transaminase